MERDTGIAGSATRHSSVGSATSRIGTGTQIQTRTTVGSANLAEPLLRLANKCGPVLDAIQAAEKLRIVPVNSDYLATLFSAFFQIYKLQSVKKLTMCVNVKL